MVFNFKKITVLLSTFIIIIAGFLLSTTPAFAQAPTEKKAGASCTPPVDSNANSVYVYDDAGNCVETNICGTLPDKFCKDVVSAPAVPGVNPIGGFKPVVDSIANIIVVLYGIFAVLVLVVSGIQVSASAGNENVVKNAKENIFNVITGLVLLVSFRAILGIINTAFEGVSTTGSLFETGPNNGLQLSKTGIPLLLGNIISIASFFSGIVAVIFIIVGGIRLITSAGIPKAIEGARKTIIYAVAGLVLSISAYGILVFIQSQLTR